MNTYYMYIKMYIKMELQAAEGDCYRRDKRDSSKRTTLKLTDW